MLRPLTALFLLTLFISCQTSQTEPEQATEQAPVSVDDSLFITNATFVTRQFNLPVQKITKYELPDRFDTIIAKAVIHLPDVKESYYSLYADKGTKYSLKLDNHTKVWLNSGTEYIFRPDIGKYSELSGEGYFEIAENATIINVNFKVKITADAGTRINIHSYIDSAREQMLTATLLQGRAILTASKLNITMRIAGTQKVIHLANQKLTERKCDTSDVLAWTKNVFNYSNIDSYSLLQRISRWYGNDLIYPDSIPVRYGAFKGSYKEPLTSIISKINQQYTGIHCAIEDQRIIVSGKK